jgi:uncharacterized LabA/DUF88 family protein
MKEGTQQMPKELIGLYDRTAILIDGVSTHSAARNLDWTIDYRKLLTYVQKETSLIKAYYFSPFDVSQDESTIISLLNWLSFNGYNTVLVEYEQDDDRRPRGNKGNIDVQFTIKALQIASKIDHIILFTGTGRYVPLVKKLDELGVVVSVCSTMKGDTKIVSDELRKCADNFIELDSLKPHIERDTKNHTYEKSQSGDHIINDPR